MEKTCTCAVDLHMGSEAVICFSVSRQLDISNLAKGGGSKGGSCLGRAAAASGPGVQQGDPSGCGYSYSPIHKAAQPQNVHPGSATPCLSSNKILFFRHLEYLLL